MSAFEPDLEQARRFIEVLAGDAPVTFQTFDDRGERALSRILHGSLTQHAAELGHLNALGAGIFVMVSAGNGKGRSAKNVVRVRALFIDTDGAPYPDVPPLKPHLTVQSSPGRWHLYWLVTGLELAAFSTLQKGLADHYSSDPAVHDTPRVMRLPGFYHLKGEPVMVRLLEAHEHPPYSHADVLAAWPFLLERLEQERRAEAEAEAQRAAILARAAERKAAPRPDTMISDHRTRAERLLQAHHDTVAAAPSGARHETLLRAARTLGGYVGAGVLEAHEALDVLTAAANVCGLPDAEAADVILWGLERGAEKPLEPTPPCRRGDRASRRSRLAGWYA